MTCRPTAAGVLAGPLEARQREALHAANPPVRRVDLLDLAGDRVAVPRQHPVAEPVAVLPLAAEQARPLVAGALEAVGMVGR